VTNQVSLRLNPEYEKLLPKMSDEEFSELKDSIADEGQHYPIVVNEDLEILDGHHRFRACLDLGLEPDFEVRKFEDKTVEKKFVIEANLRRRHLNNFQLVELGVPLLEVEKALAKKRKSVKRENGEVQGLSPDNAFQELNAKAKEFVAKKTGLSTRTFEKGKRILEEAPEEKKRELREGKTSITRVYQEMFSPEKSESEFESDFPSDFAEEDPFKKKNKAELEEILRKLVEKQLFCPSCGNAMLECSKCHKTLRQLLGL
jgi:ParB-like chromosome segregation protein Spo0J